MMQGRVHLRTDLFLKSYNCFCVARMGPSSRRHEADPGSRKQLEGPSTMWTRSNLVSRLLFEAVHLHPLIVSPRYLVRLARPHTNLLLIFLNLMLPSSYFIFPRR